MKVDDKMHDEIVERAAELIAAQVRVDASKLYDPRVGIEEAMKYFNCGRTYFDSHLMTAPDFPIHYTGRKPQFHLSELRAWEKAHPDY